MKEKLTRFLTWSSKTAGKPIAFTIAWLILIIWTILGFIYGFTTNWILIIDTIATLNASLMVFIIQSTQTRENKALHLKIDGLLHSIKETNRELIAIEEKEEVEIEMIRKKIFDKK